MLSLLSTLALILVFMFVALVLMLVAGAVSILPVIAEGVVTYLCIKFLLEKLRSFRN